MNPTPYSIKDFKQKEECALFVQTHTGKIVFQPWKYFFMFMTKNVVTGSETQYLIKSYYFISKVL